MAPDFAPAYIDRGGVYLAKGDLDQTETAATYRADGKVANKPEIAFFNLRNVLDG